MARLEVVTWKHLASGAGALVLLLAGFAAWLIHEAQSAAEQVRVRVEVIEAGHRADFLRLEKKVDRLLFFWGGVMDSEGEGRGLRRVLTDPPRVQP